jgi:hypothetical protein
VYDDKEFPGARAAAAASTQIGRASAEFLAMPTPPSSEQIQAIRQFSRFYTRRIGALKPTTSSPGP